MANILFYLDQFPAFGGIETVTATLSTLLLQRGHRVLIVSHSQDERLPAAEVVPGIVVHGFPGKKKGSSENRFFLSRLIKQKNVQIVIFQDDYSKMERNILAAVGGAKIIVCEHSSPYTPIPLTPQLSRNLMSKIKWAYIVLKVGAWSMRRHRFLYSICDAYVLLSPYLLGEFRSVTQLHDSRKLNVIPNVLPESCFAVDVSNQVGKKKQVLFVGSLIPTKGCDYLLNAWKFLCVEFPEWELVVVGGGGQEVFLKQFVQNNRLCNVRFEGYQKNTAEYFMSASVLAAPSRREGFPMVLLEAMSHGCVPVCFDSFSAVHDIVSDGRDGIVVPAFDELRFCDALRMLMTDACLLSRCASNARESSKRFAPENVLPKWEALFDALLRGEAPR